jgi:pimeloyl-ACP methyl ester carboxylesterase
MARKLVAWTLAIPGAMSRREVVLRTVFGPEEPLSDFATRGGGLLGARPSAFIGASEDLNAVNIDLPSMVGRYGEIEIPIGILFGKGDQVLDYRANAESMAAKVAGLELELLDERGHMIPMTAPEESAAFVRRMAARLAA